MPNGRRFVIFRNPSDGRSSQLRTSQDINLGPPPDKIPRQFNANNRGIVDDGNYNFQNPMDRARLPFLHVGRVAQIPSKSAVPPFSETAQVKAFSIGDNLAITNR